MMVHRTVKITIITVDETESFSNVDSFCVVGVLFPFVSITITIHLDRSSIIKQLKIKVSS